ncbi:MAG: toluene tolerance protein [Magnetovibrio sp.]|nr:toluene tolerance protein [Magnetovibrio sp.]
MILTQRFCLMSAIGLIFTLAVQASPLNAEMSGEKAEAFISGLADQAIEAMTMPDVSKSDRIKRFKVLLNENFAIKTIARYVIGRYWKRATKVQKEEYLSLFQEMLATTYVNRFAEYAGENLKVIKSTVSSDKDAIVHSQIVRDGTQPVNVDWQVRSKDNVIFKIVDIKVEGVSLGKTQKSEFSSVIRQNGGKVEGLLAVLRKRVK